VHYWLTVRYTGRNTSTRYGNPRAVIGYFVVHAVMLTGYESRIPLVRAKLTSGQLSKLQAHMKSDLVLDLSDVVGGIGKFL